MGISKKIIALIAVFIVIIALWLFLFDNNEESQSSNINGNAMIEKETASSNIIEITASGFSPNELTIKAGESVKFINKDSSMHWPASAIHPTHTVYPGSDITKCGTSEQSVIFDACKGLKEGGTFTFVFNEAGEWSYHDHLKASLRGKIIVV